MHQNTSCMSAWFPEIQEKAQTGDSSLEGLEEFGPKGSFPS